MADLSSAPAAGGVTYAQSSQPSNPSAGETFFDTDTGILYTAADLGSGSVEWHPVPPTLVTEEASTFAESDVSLTHNKTEVVSQSAGLVAEWETVCDFEDDVNADDADWTDPTGATGSFSQQTNTVLAGSGSGELTATDAANQISYTRSSGRFAPEMSALVEVGSQSGEEFDQSLISFKDSSANDFADFEFEHNGNLKINVGSSQGTWSANTTYKVRAYNVDYSAETFDWEVTNEDNSTTLASGTDEDFNSSASDHGEIEIEQDTDTDGGTRSVFVDDLVSDGPASGDVLVQWSSGVPADIQTWDLADKAVTLDGETVTVDIEDSQGNVLKSDIGPNTDISDISSSTEVRLRVNLSRTDTGNNPTVDYLARRFSR